MSACRAACSQPLLSAITPNKVFSASPLRARATQTQPNESQIDLFARSRIKHAQPPPADSNYALEEGVHEREGGKVSSISVTRKRRQINADFPHGIDVGHSPSQPGRLPRQTTKSVSSRYMQEITRIGDSNLSTCVACCKDAPKTTLCVRNVIKLPVAPHYLQASRQCRHGAAAHVTLFPELRAASDYLACVLLHVS